MVYLLITLLGIRATQLTYASFMVCIWTLSGPDEIPPDRRHPLFDMKNARLKTSISFSAKHGGDAGMWNLSV